MKSETDTRCEACRRRGVNGALFSVPVSRLEEAEGHRVYKCDKCNGRYKFIGPKEALK